MLNTKEEAINRVGIIKNSGKVCLVLYKTKYIKRKGYNFYTVLCDNVILKIFEKNVIIAQSK